MFFFFVKQKTAYEMRISDWSSDVCSSDLRAVAKQVPLSPGVSIAYSGQFEYLQHAIAKLKLVVPATLLIIFVLLYMTFGRFDDAALIMGTLPFALTDRKSTRLNSSH